MDIWKGSLVEIMRRSSCQISCELQAGGYAPCTPISNRPLARPPEMASFSEIGLKTRFFTNGLHMEDGEVIGPRKFESWRCASFLFVWILRINWFSGLWTFREFSDIFRDFWRTNSFFSKNDPEVSGSARGASPTYPALYLTFFDENRLKHNYCKNQY